MENIENNKNNVNNKENKSNNSQSIQYDTSKINVINIDLNDIDDKEKNSKKKLEIVKGNSKDLNISKVQDSLAFEAEENDEENKGKIVVPKNQDN